jgi:hypothetical protein
MEDKLKIHNDLGSWVASTTIRFEPEINRKSKDRQYNSHKNKSKMTTNGHHKIYIKLKVEQHEPPLKPGVSKVLWKVKMLQFAYGHIPMYT